MILLGLLSGTKPISSSASPNVLASVTRAGSGFFGLSVFPATFVPPGYRVVCLGYKLSATGPTSDLVWISKGAKVTVLEPRIRRQHRKFRIGSSSADPLTSRNVR